jgi:S-adenosylmethionine-dependent methyltransferase
VETTSRRERAAPSRQRLVTRLLVEAMWSVAGSGAAPTVLDCGGGSGSAAVPLARAGAHVTVVDVSPDALATLRRRAAEAGVDDVVVAVPGDVETLADLVRPGSFDLALAHEVLEAVDHPDVALGSVAAAVRPGGLVSVLVSNPVAGVLARALAGEVATALVELRALSDPSPGGLDLVRLRALCDQRGLAVEQEHGVGVFTEIVPGADLDPQRGGASNAEALAQLEELASGRSPFREIASRIHVLARRPG